MANHLRFMFYCFFIVFALQKQAAAVRYVVGDGFGWTVPPNTSFYTQWANSKTFQIGDVVEFNWTGTHTVAEVGSIAEYENCTKPGITFGKEILMNLVSNGSRFFVCTVSNHCERGQKVIITVGSPTNTSSSFSSASTFKTGVSLLVFSILGFSFFSYF